MSEIKRKKGESFEAYMRRMKREWKNSGVILQAKKMKNFAKKPSKNVQQKQSVRGMHKASKIAYLTKTGKMKEETPFQS